MTPAKRTPVAPPARRAPRPRTGSETKTTARTTWYDREFAGFIGRAQTWLLSRPGKQVNLPKQLNLVAAIGIPCRDCKTVIHRQGESGHTVRWVRAEKGGHWASGITVSCPG
jgi:hypothetical protein